jgi:hypothetical protein
MPTIDRYGPFRIMIHTDDHEPAHVHFYCGAGYAKVQVGCCAGGVQLVRTAGLTMKELAVAVRRAEEMREEYLGHWRRIHG